MIGKTISHYKILEKLGEGGMGIVYKAEDTKLKRIVALKFLKPQSLGSIEDKARFLHEAQAAASLDHPNICTIYAIEETEGNTFIAIAYLEGESLKEKIQKGPLKIEEALDITIQIADGLHQAHQKGIVHRDVKSGNIMITALGLVKVMDFGLARLAGRTTITETGTTLGTPGYMSPEQARGEKVDNRTDIWSLGVVIYEMITGKLPFRGDYQEAVIYSILNEQPEPPTALRTGVPMELEKIVSKALAKKPEERYQRLDELLVDVRRLKKETEQNETLPKTSVRGKEYRKLSAIMFSDIVAYSKIMQRDEDLAMGLLSRHNQIVRDVIKKHSGTEIKVVGDAFLVDFETVANAVRCAIEVQESFSKYNEDKPEAQRILLRIGIHVGDVIVKENDVFGDGVNIASRIEPLAEPGGICISQEVYNMVKHKLDVEIVSLGPKELKNIRDKIEIYEILVGSIAGKELATSGRRIVERGKPMHKRLGTWIVVGIIFLCIAIGVFLLQFKKPETSSQMVSRALKIPSRYVTDPNISTDGNWVVYIANDSKPADNLFVVHADGNQPKKITNDTNWRNKEAPCFSSDASEVFYYESFSIFDSTKQKIKYKYDIYKVSTLGGTPKKVINDGLLPTPSSDGIHIAFIRYNSPDELLMIANLDGTAQREITKHTQHLMYQSLSWSPDGKKIAHLHNFESKLEGHYTEIFTCDVNSGEERQITFFKMLLSDICWLATGEFVFSSIRDESENLWIMSVSKEFLRQLTFGTSESTKPSVSRNSNRLVFCNYSVTGNLWEVNVVTGAFNQLTFEDTYLKHPKYSPDGRKILYINSKASGDEQLFICNMDGSEAIQISHLAYPQLLNTSRFCWSGDGKSIAYTVLNRDTISQHPDSFYFYITIQNLETGSTTNFGNGILIDWSLDGKYILLKEQVDVKNKYLLVLTISPSKPIKLLESFHRPSFTKDSKNVLFTDSTYLWNFSIAERKAKPLQILTKNFQGTEKRAYGSEFDKEKKKWVFYKYSEFGYKEKKLFELEGAIFGVDITPDKKRIILSRQESKSSVVLLENFR
jgi:serine/threonine protein kinase/Tol biopolymer transport system component